MNPQTHTGQKEVLLWKPAGLVLLVLLWRKILMKQKGWRVRVCVRACVCVRVCEDGDEDGDEDDDVVYIFLSIQPVPGCTSFLLAKTLSGSSLIG